MVEPHIEYFLKSEEEKEEEEENQDRLLSFLCGVNWGEINFKSNYIVENMDSYRIPDSIHANRDLFNNMKWDFNKSIERYMARGYKPDGCIKRFIPPQYIQTLRLPYKADGSSVCVKAQVTYFSTHTMLCCVSHFYSSNFAKLEPGFLTSHVFAGFSVALPENCWTLLMKNI